MPEEEFAQGGDGIDLPTLNSGDVDGCVLRTRDPQIRQKETGMLLRELAGGDPPHISKLILIDNPTGFGHRVIEGDRVLEHVLTKSVDFEQATAEKIAEGFVETERSLTRRVFTTAERFWIISLDGDTVRTQAGVIRADWRESTGKSRSKEFRDRDRAIAAYHKAIVDKRDEGFFEKFKRDVVFVNAPDASKKPGKKKSR